MKRFETQKLQEIDSMKSRFFANISHEFRTPLTLILGPLSQMLAQAKNKDKKQVLSLMQRNARRLQRLINQLLDLSKIDAGKMTLHTRPENVVSLLNRIVQTFESQAILKEIELKFQSSQDEIMAFIDRDQIETIFYNLISNALKFTPRGGTVTCGIQLATRQSEIVIAVADTGIGIPPDHLNKIFDRFYRVDDFSTREHAWLENKILLENSFKDTTYVIGHEGTGIGLALTKELVELHHGKIAVSSVPNQGTTVTVYLPLGKAHLKPAEIIAETPADDIQPRIAPIDLGPEIADDEQAKDKSRRKAMPIVLIVEDNRDMRSYLRDCLGNAYRVIEAVDGADGLETGIEKIPDLIISDVMMPQMDGFQLCERLKSDERTSHIPVILLTARAAAESKIKGLDLGADDYLIKPFDRAELLVRVKNLIRQRQRLREKFTRDVTIQPKDVAVSSYDERFLQRALAIIEQHISDSEFTVALFSKEIGMSRVQLHRKLCALTNCSAREFIQTLRLKRAAQLLRQHAGNVTEIAYEVGFNNLSYFSQCFRKQFGMLPSEYTHQ